MSIKAEILDGSGKGVSANVDSNRNLSVSNSNIPPEKNPSNIRIFRQFFTDDGTPSGSKDMRVVGSLTSPLDFFISASSDSDRYIDSVSFVIADAGATLSKFGNITALTNGVEILYEDPVLGDVVIHDGITSNFDLIRLCGKGAPMVSADATAFQAKNVIGASEGYIPILDFSDQFGIPWGIRIAKGTTLKIKIRVKDDTTGVDQFDAIAYGYDRIIK